MQPTRTLLSLVLLGSSLPGVSQAAPPAAADTTETLPANSSAHVELVPGAPPLRRPYTQLFVFGDSYSDTGAGYLDGNGATAVAYMAQRLGIPFTYYGASDLKGKGINFAVSGARTGEGAGKRYAHGELLSVGMVNQVQEFADLLKAKTLSFDPAQTLFYLAGGLNDRTSADGYTRTNLEQEIDSLYSLGARRFMVALLPVKIPQFDVPGMRLNPELVKIPAEERLKHPDIRIANSDWGPFFDRVITHPEEYGLSDTTSTCAGRVLRDQNPDPCPHPETHFFYHEGHPSTATHKAVGEMLYQEAITNAP